MYDKICIINNVGLIQITHIFKKFVKYTVQFKDPRIFLKWGVLCVQRQEDFGWKTTSIQLKK